MTHFEIGAGGLAVLSLALVPVLGGPAPETGVPVPETTGPVPAVVSLDRDMKCGPQPEGAAALIAVDGLILDVQPPPPTGRPSLDRIVEREDIFWLQMVCMDPRDSTFQRDHGLPVVSIWTKQGPAGQMTPALAEIVEAQERHFEHEGRYLEDLSVIEGFMAPDRVEIELEADADFWVATARTERLLGRCTAGGGTATAPSEPECADDR